MTIAITPKIADCVAETTDTVGVGDLNLTGPIIGFTSFSTLGGDCEVYYTIQEGFDKEIGLGNYVSSTNTIKRTSIIATIVGSKHSTGGTPLNLKGSAEVFCTIGHNLIEEICEHINGNTVEIVALKSLVEQISGDLSGYVTNSELSQTQHNSFPGRDATGAHPASAIEALSGKSVEQELLDRATHEELTMAQGDVLDGKLFKGSNGETVEAGDDVPEGTTHLRVLVGGVPKIVGMSPRESGAVSQLSDLNATINGTTVDFIFNNFTLRFDSIANMLAGIPVRSEPGDICIVLDTTFEHNSGDGFTITDFKPLSYRGGKAYDKTTIESLRRSLSGVVDPALLQYGSRKMVNNPAFTDTIEDVANFAGQGQGSSAPIGWIHHHYTDGIMHQWDNVGNGTMLYLKNARNPGRRPDKPSSYVGQGKFLSLGTEGFVGVGSERFFISKDVEFVYKKRQVAKFLSDLDPNDGDGFAFITSCYRAMELVQKWSSNGDDLMYVRRAPNGQPQFRLFKSGAFGTDGLILDLSTQNGGTVRILTGPTSSNIDAGAGDLNLRPSSDAGAAVYANGPLKLKTYTTGDLPALPSPARALAWDITQDALVKWDGSSWSAV